MTVNELMEISFDLAYLAVIYALVIMMIIRLNKGNAKDMKACRLFIAAFLLLAIGDTGHVGFRVIAYLSGGLEVNSRLLGAGSFSTAFTVTLFYMLMLEAFRLFTGRKRTAIYWLVLTVGLIRLAFLFLPGNNWGGEIPLGWSYSRNAMLTLMGLIIAVLYLKEGIQKKDRTLKLFGIYIFISYGFYLPVILFVHALPALGMLMIPKTLAYVAIAVTGYKNLFKAGVKA